MTVKFAILERGLLVDGLRGLRNISADILELRDGRLPITLKQQSVAVGFPDDSGDKLPQFVVVPNGGRRDFFAWINTYAPFVTPLSQWCHVLTQDDLARTPPMVVRPDFGSGIAPWAGVIIGEALVRTRAPSRLSQISVSALQSSPTFVAARAIGLWGSNKVRDSAVRQYHEARSILGQPDDHAGLDYHTIWSVLDLLSDRYMAGEGSPNAINEVIAKCCANIREDGFVGEALTSEVLIALDWPAELAVFERANAEDRIRVFQASIERLSLPDRRAERTFAEFLVAYFAARIGGSTSSRVQLLEGRFGDHPNLALWYGLVSALHRPEIWGAEFDGLGRLAIRELAFPLRFDEPPRCDITFEELLALVDPEVDLFTLNFRSAMRKALVVEVEPGVNSTVRMGLQPDDETATELATPLRKDVAALIEHLADATKIATRFLKEPGASTTRSTNSAAKRRTAPKRTGSKSR